MSALAAIFGQLGELSGSELRQLYLALGVRLGIPDVPTGAKPQQKDAGKSGNAKASGGKTTQKPSSSKGNPQRKSQWANHPLYQEYSRLKKVVEKQAKESKLSFNAVDTAESRAYQKAFTDWVEAKHSFRGHGESGQIRAKPEEGNESGEEPDEEEAPVKAPASSSKQGIPASPQAKPAAAGKPSVSARSGGGSPPDKGKAAAKKAL